jgi:hypothetical protein
LQQVQFEEKEILALARRNAVKDRIRYSHCPVNQGTERRCMKSPCTIFKQSIGDVVASELTPVPFCMHYAACGPITVSVHHSL